MALDYEIDNKLKSLAAVIDEHGEWLGRATKRIFFAAKYKGQDKLPVPIRFQEWSREAEDYDFIDPVTLQDLKKMYEELHITATGLADKAMYTEDDVTYEEYDHFVSLYESFIQKLRRLEYDCALSDSGMDVDTGLRSPKAMELDITRELERRARRGNPFTLVLARINNYDELRSMMEIEQNKDVLQKVGKLIKKCIRSFDDAYRSSEGEFIMSLKHSEAAGGTAAVNRLRRFLMDEDIVIKKGNEEIPLTMSYCVAEPVPGDTLEDLLENMRYDLDKWDGGDTALEYHEQSPLSRYIDEKN
ncbi:MAG: diguanylate cyclase [Rhodospirillales bacterium]|nr:diguanylate cyclase [Rhodospirillales bacterium]MCB9995833.1 diguanylate cyclase [Rhodospirillales bacterium]